MMYAGFGKSLCYQYPAVLRQQGLVLVVSPLISLMEDQVAALRYVCISAPHHSYSHTVSQGEQWLYIWLTSIFTMIGIGVLCRGTVYDGNWPNWLIESLHTISSVKHYKPIHVIHWCYIVYTP